MNKRYLVVEELGHGGMGIVYRALDRLTGQMIALKRVTGLQFVSSDDIVKFQTALAHEFRTLASLRHPYIISVLDYGFAGGQPFFTMDYLEHLQRITEAKYDPALLIGQTLQALAYLHRRGIVHHDLKPDNIVVVEQDGKPYVKLLDFGLAHDQSDNSSPLTGTLAYMSPELLRGDPYSTASDIFAVGVIAYEVFTGRHPFHSSSVMTMIERLVAGDFDMPDIDEGLSQVIMRMMHEDAGERYASANDALSALSEACNLSLPDNNALRESFLQAASFVGREVELDLLVGALEVLAAHNPAVGSQPPVPPYFLIGGESGVGKSRLVDEVRIRALIQGIQVIRGQAVSEESAPYRLWHDVMHWLALITPLNDLEASVLKPFIPNLTELLNRDIPDAPQMANGRATRDRLMAVMLRLLASQSLLLILEDLQWADEDSLELLRRLDMYNLMVIATYRSDEMSKLPKLLTSFAAIKLERFTKENVAQLSEAMLGTRAHDIVGFLNQETEGNALFLVEVVRALAEDAGQLERIGVVTLPVHVFAGGMQTVITRRLSRVPENERKLLNLAALRGRELDLPMLRVLVTGQSLEEWLLNCSDAAVIEIQNERWCLSHDQLREAIVAAIPESDLAALHRQIAEALETAYPDTYLIARELCEHWRLAGDAQKQLHYLVEVVREGREHGLYHEILPLTLQGLAIAPPGVQRLHLLSVSSLIYEDLGKYAESLHMMQERIALSRQLNEMTYLAHGLAHSAILHLRMGNIPQTQAEITEAISLVDQVDNFNTFLNIFFTQGFFMMVMGDFTAAVACYQKLLSMTDEQTSSGHLAFILVNFAVVLYAKGDLEEARSTAQRAREQAQRSCAVMYDVFGKLIIAASSLRLGQPDNVRELVLTSMKYALSVNDALFLLLGCGLLSWVTLLQGDAMRGAQLLGAVLTPNADALGRQLLLDPLHKQYMALMPEDVLKAALARGAELGIRGVLEPELAKGY
jgi:eukaryotic-like serine/threonine-protein kinase